MSKQSRSAVARHRTLWVSDVHLGSVGCKARALIEFLKRNYREAARALQDVLEIDPEDVQAHYNLMLCYRGLGKPELASREQILFQRFKADESSQFVTAKPRLLSPEDNNERQQIHDHPTAFSGSTASGRRVVGTR